MAASPQYTAAPVLGAALCSAANANRDGTGTLYTIVTGATDGTRIDRITAQAIVSTTAGMLRLYVTPPASTARLYLEVPIQAVTASGTVAAWHSEIALQGGMVLPSGYILAASIQNANATMVFALGGAF
jgi:hypothetical protein